MQGSTRGVPIDTDNTLSLDSDIVVASQKAVKAYITTQVALKQNILGYTPVNVAGDTMTGYLTLHNDPLNALHAATKQYVDNIVSGINFHKPAHAATTANLSATYSNGTAGVGAKLTATANGALVVDGHTMLVNERVLVWQQTSGLQNGIYNVTQTGTILTPFILTRANDDDQSPSEMSYGDFCFVQNGTLYGGYGFINNTSGTITIGTTAITYVQFNAAQVVTAGYGLLESTPNVLSVDTTVIAPLSSPAFTGTVSGITKSMVGLGSVVNADTTTTANITDSTNKRFVTDAQLVVIGNTSGTNTGDETGSTIKTKLGAATALVSGYLSNTDFATFNGKQNAITTGTTAQYFRGDLSLATFPTIPAAQIQSDWNQTNNTLLDYIKNKPTIPSVTPAALTKTDDTNVTLTLGGSPSTALLQATSLTLGWTGTLADSRIASATTWNAKQNALSGTGFVKSTIGVISYDTSTYTPTSRNLTINGTTYDLSADRTWTIASYSLPISTASVLGGVKIGSGVTVGVDGTISVSTNYQAPLSGSGIVKSTAGTISYLTDNTSNWNTAYSSRINTFTTTGSSGSATFNTNTLNIPTYTLSGLGGEPTITAGTSSQYWRGDKTWQTFPTIPTVGTWGALNYPTWVSGTPFVKMTAAGTFTLDTNTYGTGTVTSVGVSMPTGFTVGSSPVTSSGTIAVTFTSGYSLPTTTSQTNWDTAYTNRITSLTVTGSSGAATLSSNTLNIPTYTLAGLGGQASSTNLTSLSGLTYASTSFVKMTASGTFTLDTATYLTSITSGDVTTALGYTPVTNARTISTTAPLTGGGDLTANRTFAITQSTTSTDGYLSSTDWTTFNNKTRLQFTNSTGTQSITAATVTYLTNSNISTTNIKAGTVVTWDVSVTKTAAGVAAPIWTVRFGTTSSTSDATILTFTGSVQTAAIDTGMFTIKAVFRTVGSGTSAVLFGHYALVHNLATTGLANASQGVVATSSGFDSTTASAFLGLTVNSGAAAVWTVNQVFVKIENIN